MRQASSVWCVRLEMVLMWCKSCGVSRGSRSLYECVGFGSFLIFCRIVSDQFGDLGVFLLCCSDDCVR